MLRITDQAATLLKEARTRLDSSPQGGARLAPEPSPQGVSISIDFVDAPERSDEVIEQAGMRVFVASELAKPLADKTLDAQPTPDGAELTLKPQQ